MSSIVWALLWVLSLKRERGNLTTSVQSSWRIGDRHRLGAQLGTDPCASQQCNIKPGMIENSFWSFPSLLMGCSCSCGVVQLSRSPHTLPTGPDHVEGVQARAPNYTQSSGCLNAPCSGQTVTAGGRRGCDNSLWEGFAGHYRAAPHAVRAIPWVLACDRSNNRPTLYDTASTFGFLTGVCCRVSFLSDKTEKRKIKQNNNKVRILFLTKDSTPKP